MGVAYIFMWQLFKENTLEYNFWYFILWSILFYLGLTLVSLQTPNVLVTWIAHGDYSLFYNPYPLEKYGLSRYARFSRHSLQEKFGYCQFDGFAFNRFTRFPSKSILPMGQPNLPLEKIT